MSRPILVSVTAAVVAALFAGAAQAQPTAPDTGAIKACLKRQEAALGHACIGIVADPCTDAAGGDTAKRKACADRERAVWQAELEAALRGVRKGGFKDITEFGDPGPEELGELAAYTMPDLRQDRTRHAAG